MLNISLNKMSSYFISQYSVPTYFMPFIMCKFLLSSELLGFRCYCTMESMSQEYREIKLFGFFRYHISFVSQVITTTNTSHEFESKFVSALTMYLGNALFSALM